VALGYVPRELADETDGWSIEILGEMRRARLQAKPLRA
jgi:dimethylglycine dehydrogenase